MFTSEKPKRIFQGSSLSPVHVNTAPESGGITSYWQQLVAKDFGLAVSIIILLTSAQNKNINSKIILTKNNYKKYNQNTYEVTLQL